MTFSMGGYGLEGKDPDLQDKIAKLKQKRMSGKQRVEKFLENELHVDPRDLPFNVDSAKARLKEIMDLNGSELANFIGNSMGLKSVVFKTEHFSDATCTACGRSYGYWDTTGAGSPSEPLWFCYDCETHDTNGKVPDTTVCTATENDNAGQDWHDIKRCHNAFVKGVTLTSPATDEIITCHSFDIAKSYYGVDVSAVAPVTPEADISKYPSGAVLRIQKATFQGGDMEVERQYVRIGGLFDDTTPTNLDTMMPISDLTGWTVIEEL